MGRNDPAWTEVESKLPGKKNETEAARVLGRSPQIIYQRHKRLAVPRAHSFGAEWTAREDRLLSSLDDEEMARFTGHTIGAIRMRRHVRGLCRKKKCP